MTDEERKEQHDPTDHAQDDVASGEPVDGAAAAEEAEVDEVTRLRGEVEAWRDKFLRAKAEQQNVARRAANEIEDAIRFANAGLLRSVLEVMDDFDRTIQAAESGESPEAILQGITLTRRKLEKVLQDNQVEVIQAENERFDPARHEALMQQPSAEHEPGQVVQEIQKGYKLRERVLRPAKVIVASAPTSEGAE